MRWMALGGVAASVVGCTAGDGVPVGVTLDDGQVLVGSVRTEGLHLTGAFGDAHIPLDDVGMILPVEGRTLEDSNGHVTVWLRNGSELRGEWAQPELRMGLAMGGGEVTVDLEPERMQTMQLRASEQWPENGLYRVRTTWGDDFLVDPATTRVVVKNELGTFSPFLSECQAVGPVADPTQDWRVELVTGTVLIGPLDTSQISFRLPMGPDTIDVPLEALASLDRGVWNENYALGSISGSQPQPGRRARYRPLQAADAPAEMSTTDRDAEQMPVPMSVSRPAPKPVTAQPGLAEGDGWFDNRRMEAAKY